MNSNMADEGGRPWEGPAWIPVNSGQLRVADNEPKTGEHPANALARRFDPAAPL